MTYNLAELKKISKHIEGKYEHIFPAAIDSK